MTLSDKSKQAIDLLTFEELQAEVLLDNKSRFQGDKAGYVSVRFAQLKEEKRDAQRAEDIESEREKTNIAKETNDISREANKFSKLAVWVSVFALIISLWNFVHNISNNNTKNESSEVTNSKKP